MKKIGPDLPSSTRRPSIPFRRVIHPGKSPQDGLSRKDRERLVKELEKEDDA